jgi:peroxiredoxin (alkyl hydroperoxide reductase subunit C)
MTVGDQFPDSFVLNGVDRYNNMVKFTDNDLFGDWSVIYFYPKDFTFICPTEIAAFDGLVGHCNVIGISGDNEFCKLAWKTSVGMIRTIKHTLVADCGLGLSEELGVVNREEGVCYRATYILDEEATIQHVSINALDTGRNADEILRTLQALKAGGLTGCSWQPGEDFVA